MDASIVSIILTILITAIIGGMKYYERKYGANPEAWDMQKFGLLIVVAVIVMLVEYGLGNAIVFPGEDVIAAGLALFGTAYALLTGGKLATAVIQNKVPTQFPIGGDITNPALLGLDPVVVIGARTYHPVFKMDDVIMKTITSQLSTEDVASVKSQVAAAEAQRNGMGIPYYVVTYSKGYYDITYGAVPTNGDVYFKALVQSSGSDKL